MGMVIGMTIIGLPLSCLIAGILTRGIRRRKDLTKLRKGLIWVWASYALLVFFATVGVDLLILGPAAFHPPVHLINVVPFVWIQETYQMGVARMIEQLLLNIVMFVPLGFLTPVCFPKFRSLRTSLLSMTGYSLTIEILQFFIGRSADIDDLIMNTLGGILGWLIFCAVRRTQPGREKLLKDFSE